MEPRAEMKILPVESRVRRPDAERVRMVMSCGLKHGARGDALYRYTFTLSCGHEGLSHEPMMLGSSCVCFDERCVYGD